MKTITAEEKHYKKLNKKLSQNVNRYQELYTEEQEKNKQLTGFIKEKDKKIEALFEENEKLKTMVNLTDDEVKELIKSTKNQNEWVGMTKMLLGNLSRY
jgi:cell shape-determining protein MreC